MSDLVPDRTLINSKFEGYKLQIIDQENAVARFPLPYFPTQSAATGNSWLTFKQVQNRIGHNHLAVAKGTVDGNIGRAAYVDADLKVVLIEVTQNTDQPSFRVIYELPKPLLTTHSEDRQHEYPSSLFPDPSVLFVSDGRGLLYILSIEVGQAAKPLAVYELPNSYPFRLHGVDAIGLDACVATFSFHRDEKKGKGKASKGTSLDEYEVCAARFTIPPPITMDSQPQAMEIIWWRRGSNAPVDVAFDPSTHSHLLLGGSPYATTHDADSSIAREYEPSSDEIAPIPGTGEDLDDEAQKSPKPPPPFSWTQTSDSLMIAVPLPSSTAKCAIRVTFTTRTLSLHVMGPHDNESNILSPPSYVQRMLWDEIVADESLWTWDRDAEHSYGVLTLHLEKKHEGTKWTYLFEQSSSSPAEDNVEETLDPSELYNIRESLEKYTAALRTGEDISGLELGRGVPSLAQGELDDEVDSSVGRQVYQTWVSLDSTTKAVSQSRNPFALLSTSLPGSTLPTSLIIKTGIDGAHFSITSDSPSTAEHRWRHTSTFSALAFVIASKRDCRYTYHTSNTVFAFESGIQRGSGNVFIYRSVANSMDVWAKQSILKVTNAGSALLGTGVVKVDDQHEFLLCLTENELVVIRGVL